jgi:hypothetical protein
MPYLLYLNFHSLDSFSQIPLKSYFIYSNYSPLRLSSAGKFYVLVLIACLLLCVRYSG